jgi:hypothetical protein
MEINPNTLWQTRRWGILQVINNVIGHSHRAIAQACLLAYIRSEYHHCIHSKEESGFQSSKFLTGHFSGISSSFGLNQGDRLTQLLKSLLIMLFHLMVGSQEVNGRRLWTKHVLPFFSGH